MGNKFAEQRKKRNADNMTEELANRLYEDVAENSRPENVNEKVSNPVEAGVVKRGRGRPKKEDADSDQYSVFNFRINNDLKDSIKLAASAHNLSMSNYIIKLIEDDLSNNLSSYQQLKEIREKLGC